MVGGLCGSMLESASVSICITVTPAQELARKFGKDPRDKNTLHAVSLPVPAIASLLGHRGHTEGCESLSYHETVL